MIRLSLMLFLSAALAFSSQAQLDAFQKLELDEKIVAVDCQFFKSEHIDASKALDLEAQNSFQALLSSFFMRGSVPELQQLDLQRHTDEEGKVHKITARSLVSSEEKGKMWVHTVTYYLYDSHQIYIDQAFYYERPDSEEPEIDQGWILLDLETGAVDPMTVNGSEKDPESLSDQNQKVAKASYEGALLFKDIF